MPPSVGLGLARRRVPCNELLALIIIAFCLGYLASDADMSSFGHVQRPSQALQQRVNENVKTGVGPLLPASPPSAPGLSQVRQRSGGGGSIEINKPTLKRKGGNFDDAKIDPDPVDSAAAVSVASAAAAAAAAGNFDDISNSNSNRDFTVHIVVVVCGERVAETSTLARSIIQFSRRSRVKLHFFADAKAQSELSEYFTQWPGAALPWVSVSVRKIAFPERDRERWAALFRPCAAQRLFLPEMLPEVSRAIYLDTDTLLLADVADLNDYFDDFNSTHISAMTREGELKSTNWYARHALHPFYGELGLNSGVMLMQLDRMRKLQWSDEFINLYTRYKSAIPWGDQDLLNIYFALHPDRFYPDILCPWNYRPDHCTYHLTCFGSFGHNHAGNRNGAALLHGNRRVFHNREGQEGVRPSNVMPVWRELYTLISSMEIGRSIDPIALRKYRETASTNSVCGDAVPYLTHYLDAPNSTG